MHEAALRAAVGQHERLLLHEVVRDLVEHLARREEHVLERLLHAAHDHVAIRDGVVRGRVVMRPVLAPERLVGAQPRFLAAILRQAAQLGAGIEVVIRRLPAVAAAAAMDHHPDRAVVAVDLHLDEVIAAADRAELRQRLVARAADAIGIERRLVDRRCTGARRDRRRRRALARRSGRSPRRRSRRSAACAAADGCRHRSRRAPRRRGSSAAACPRRRRRRP